MTDDQIHWFSIVNSVMIVLFLSGMVAMIMVRTLYRDISKYNQLDTQEDAAEETGWKLVSTTWGHTLSPHHLSVQTFGPIGAYMCHSGRHKPLGCSNQPVAACASRQHAMARQNCMWGAAFKATQPQCAVAPLCWHVFAVIASIKLLMCVCVCV